MVRHKPDETTFYTARTLTYAGEASNNDRETVKNPSHPLVLLLITKFWFIFQSVVHIPLKGSKYELPGAKPSLATPA